jgi:hypothetical protein
MPQPKKMIFLSRNQAMIKKTVTKLRECLITERQNKMNTSAQACWMGILFTSLGENNGTTVLSYVFIK